MTALNKYTLKNILEELTSKHIAICSLCPKFKISDGIIYSADNEKKKLKVLLIDALHKQVITRYPELTNNSAEWNIVEKIKNFKLSKYQMIYLTFTTFSGFDNSLIPQQVLFLKHDYSKGNKFQIKHCIMESTPTNYNL